MIRNNAKRLALSVFLPLLSLLLYLQRLRGDYSTYQLVLASAIAIMAGAGLFLYAPIVRRVERVSIAWGLFWIAVIIIGAIGLIGNIGIFHGEPWGFPLVFFAIWAPIYHKISRQEEGKVKLRFFKTLQKSQCN